MKGAKLVACLEDLGYLVLPEAPRGYYIRLAKTGRQVAYYDTTEDGAFRFGWIEPNAGNGRRDCLSWPSFYGLLQFVYPTEDAA